MQALSTITAQTMTLKEITDLLTVEHNKAMATVAKMATDPEFGEVVKITTSYENNIGAKLPIETNSKDTGKLTRITRVFWRSVSNGR